MEFAPNEAPKYGVDEYAMAAAVYTILVAKLHAFASGKAIERGITFSFHKDLYKKKYVFCINRELSFVSKNYIEIQNGLPLFMAIRTVLMNQEKLIGKVHLERYTAFGDGVTYVPAKYYPVYILSAPSGIMFMEELNGIKATAKRKVADMSFPELRTHAYHVQLVLARVSGTKFYAGWLKHELEVYQKLNGTMTYWWWGTVKIENKVGLIEDARPKKFVTMFKEEALHHKRCFFLVYLCINII